MVLKALKLFALLLTDKHVTIRTDNKRGAASTNCQSSICSARLLELTRSLLWSHRNPQSIRRPFGWKVGVGSLTCSDNMGQVQESIGGLFTSHENTKCALLFSRSPQDFPPLVMDTISHLPWPKAVLYTCPRVILIPRLLASIQEEELTVIHPECTSASLFLTLMSF